MRLLTTTLLSLPVIAHAQSGALIAGWRLSDVVGCIAFAALAGMLVWHLRR